MRFSFIYRLWASLASFPFSSNPLSSSHALQPPNTSTSFDMLSSSSPTPQRTAPPEILAMVMEHLSYADLFSCVQVSKDWLDFFSSALWHTVDDSRLSGFRKCLSQHWRQDSCACNINARKVLIKYGEHIRNLNTGWSLTMAILASAPNLRPRICSLVLLNNTQFPLLTRDQVASIMCGRQQKIGDLDLQDAEKVLDSCLTSALGDGARYQRQLHARIFVLLLLQNAGTLTMLHLKSNVDILQSFQSINGFYRLLTRLPALNDLQVSGDDISIVALKQVSPSLTSLHLTTKSPKVKRPHGYLQNLVKPVEISGPEWLYLSEITDVKPLQSLSLNFIISGTELHWILTQFPIIQHLSLALDTNDLIMSTFPLELYPGLRSFKITRYRTGWEWEQGELFRYLVHTLPHFRHLDTLTLPGIFYKKYLYDVRRIPCLASVRIVKHVHSQ